MALVRNIFPWLKINRWCRDGLTQSYNIKSRIYLQFKETPKIVQHKNLRMKCPSVDTLNIWTSSNVDQSQNISKTLQQPRVLTEQRVKTQPSQSNFIAQQSLFSNATMELCELKTYFHMLEECCRLTNNLLGAEALYTRTSITERRLSR